MSSLFLSYLLLSQTPSKTTVGSRKILPAAFCNNTFVNSIEKFCKKIGKKDTNVQEGLALQQRPRSEFPVISSHRDVEALTILSEFIPEFPQELKATPSDNQSFLRKIQDPKERSFALGALGVLAVACCVANCIHKAKTAVCH